MSELFLVMFLCAVDVAITQWPSASVILFLQDVKELQFGKKRHRTSMDITGFNRKGYLPMR